MIRPFSFFQYGLYANDRRGLLQASIGLRAGIRTIDQSIATGMHHRRIVNLITIIPPNPHLRGRPVLGNSHRGPIFREKTNLQDEVRHYM